MHDQILWRERADDVRLPLWLRVSALAYGRHRGNGHATFEPGSIKRVLAVSDKATGELRPNPNIDRAIRTAVEYGWLGPKSCTRCLVVPINHVRGGAWGKAGEPCSYHDRGW